MKNKLVWLAAVALAAGVSAASAEDEIGVAISGTIANAEVVGCSADETDLAFVFDGTTDDWAQGGDGRYSFGIPSDTGELNIDCNGAAGTKITFGTSANNTCSGVANGGRCTSYGVVFQPDPAACSDSTAPGCITDNLQEGQVNVGIASCNNAGTSCGTASLLNDVAITAGDGDVKVTFRGRLYANVENQSLNLTPYSGPDDLQGAPTGEIMASPWKGEPTLYVIYGE